VAKYDAALKLEPSNGKAMYEKSYSLIELKKYAESAELLKTILKDSKDPEYRKLSYVNYGTVLDYMGDKSKSLEIYDKGMKEFPKFLPASI
jgi:tetratricopeptide (TPR) repeat protein